MFYFILAIAAVVSVLMIRESRIVSRPVEWLFGMYRGQFFAYQQEHSKLVSMFKWPLLLFLVGIVLPTPLFLDEVIFFFFGLGIEVWRYIKYRKAVPNKELTYQRE